MKIKIETTLRKKIDNKGLRHNFVAQEIGVHESALNHWMQRRRPIPICHSLDLARFLECHETDIVEETRYARLAS